MACHVVAAGQREDVEAHGGGGRRRGATGEFRAAAPAGRGADRRALRVVTIAEAGLDGFWLHRVLEAQGIESHVVDAASVAVSRRRRRGKRDGIDGETLLRTFLAFRRGEPRVCSMVRPPSAEAEDRRRVVRERTVLIRERVADHNRIRGLLMRQGVTDFNRCGAIAASAWKSWRPATAAPCRRR